MKESSSTGASRPETETAPHGARAAGGTETILIVEDDRQVGDLITRVLTGHGYTILRAHDGQEAVRMAAEHDGPIELLLSDVVLPGLRGPEVATRLVQARPELRVLMISGYIGTQRAGELALHGANLLNKPFTPGALVQRVRDVLDAAPLAEIPGS